MVNGYHVYFNSIMEKKDVTLVYAGSTSKFMLKSTVGKTADHSNLM